MQLEIGSNKTGIATSREASQRMIEGTREFPVAENGDEQAIAITRGAFAKEAERVGSVPPPATLKGAVKTVVSGIKAAHPTQFLDKLGARLAYERTGVRLYQALITKHEVSGGFDGGPTRAELEEIMRDEHEHFMLLVDAVARMGGDPTVMTPSADVQATMSKGLLEVIVDPRTTFVQCLEALLVVELADNDAWDMLIELARENDDELARAFATAQSNEDEHLENVRTWLAAAHKLPSE
jgi:bacterioferritin (cytochrome b1)